METEEKLFHTLGRLEGKVDSLLQSNSRLESIQGAHDVRIRDLEKHRSFIMGMAALISGALSMAVSLAAKLLHVSGPNP
jgi:hypothetical protein